MRRSRPWARKRQRHRNPTWRSDGTRTSAWAAIPSVVPMPSTAIWVFVMVDGSSVFGPGSVQNTQTVAMVITLLSTGGDHAGGQTLRGVMMAVIIAARRQ